MWLLQSLAMDIQEEVEPALAARTHFFRESMSLGSDTPPAGLDLSLHDEDILAMETVPEVFSTGNMQLQAFVTHSAPAKQLKQDLEASV